MDHGASPLIITLVIYTLAIGLEGKAPAPIPRARCLSASATGPRRSDIGPQALGGGPCTIYRGVGGSASKRAPLNLGPWTLQLALNTVVLAVVHGAAS